MRQFQPSEPVRPVSPVQPVSPVGRDENLLRPIQPLTIPRIELSSLSRNNSPRHSPRHRGYAGKLFSMNFGIFTGLVGKKRKKEGKNLG